MTPKKYEAPTMAEALAEVKRDLGRDAVILHMRNFRKGGLWGIWGRNMWEVTASSTINVPRRLGAGEYVPEPADRQDARSEEDFAKVPLLVPAAPNDAPDDAAAAAPQRAPSAAHAPARAPESDRITSQMAEIRRMMEAIMSRTGGEAGRRQAVSAELEEFRAQLLDQDVRNETASEFVEQLRLALTGQQLSDQELIRAELRRMLASRIRTAADEPAAPPAKTGRARVIALIGPTGVGKTTTIAKLAATHKLRGRKRVGLITIDTYRIAAVDQLRTYADIIEVPLEAVLTAGELHRAVHGMRDMDVILIDTAGRSQNNQLRLNELRNFVAAARPDEVHLVVSATGNQACTRRVLDRFLPLGANRLIVSKLDEAATFGVFLNVSSATGRPISYVTTGQGVPDDIRGAKAEALADCILTGRFGDETDAG